MTSLPVVDDTLHVLQAIHAFDGLRNLGSCYASGRPRSNGSPDVASTGREEAEIGHYSSCHAGGSNSTT